MTQLTTAQQRAYDFIVEFIAAHQYPPSHQDLMDGLGLKTSSAAAYHLNILQEKGWIVRGKGARTIRILRAAA